VFRAVLAEAGVVHKRTRPYRPQSNGKVERLNLTLDREWADSRPMPATSSA
jgi:transposase InsO family protein